MKDWEDLTEEQQNALIKFLDDVIEILTPFFNALIECYKEIIDIITEVVELEN